MAGLACAHRLAVAGLSPTVFEKSRGIGGRLATRQVSNKIVFDHGAQYFTVRKPQFTTFVEALIGAGSAAVWSPRSAGSADGDDWIVGREGMNGLLAPIAHDLDIRFGATIDGIQRRSAGWVLSTDGDQQFADIVVSTIPVEQVRYLLAEEQSVQNAIADVKTAPCWALLISFEKYLECEFDARRTETGVMSWIARNSSKPGRQCRYDCWVAHANPGWSAENLELSREKAADLMLAEFRNSFKVDLPLVNSVSAHRWRYAKTMVPLGRTHAENADGSLFVGGDWTLGGRVEYAFESGNAIAEAILASNLQPYPPAVPR